MTKRYFLASGKKVIFFDLNRTLIDHKASFRSCFVEVLNEFTGRWDTGEIQWDPLEVAREFERKLNRARQKVKGTKRSLRKLQSSCLRATLEPYPIIVNDEFVRSFFLLIKQRQPSHYKLYPDTINILSALGKRYKLGLISNRSQIDLDSLGLAKLFTKQQFITPQKSKSRKPHRAIFHYAVATFNVQSNEAVMVGDSWKNDIRGATAAGLDAIWMKRHTANKAIQQKRIGKRRLIIINNLRQLLDIF